MAIELSIPSDLPIASPLLANPTHRWRKRIFDFVIAGVGLLLCLPLFLVIGALIKLTSPGPVFYAGQRVGRDGHSFKLLKFRSMTHVTQSAGPGITRHDDQRVTPIGRFLRKSKLDELPQLLNVLRGEMSLVGPRPEDPRYVALYTPSQRGVLAVLPGFTSLASIRYRNEEALLTGDNWEQIYTDKIMPDKLRVDRRYIEQWSLALDLRILLYTFIILSSTDETNLL